MEKELTLKELGFDEPCFAQYKKYDGGEATLDIGFSKNEIIMQFHKLSKFCSAPLYQQAFRWLYQKLDIEKGIMPLDTESQQLLLKELIDKVSSKHLLV